MYKLIIIDDEQGILDGIANLFPWNNIGFEIVGIFFNGKKALNYIQSHTVNVVMSDIKMPGMDGITLAKELRNYPQIKIVLFSSYQNYEYFHSAIKYHIADYLLKPIKYEELINCFAEIRENLDQEGNKAVNDKPQNYYDKIVTDVKEYISSNYQNASLEKAAAKVGLSNNYLSKVFKDNAGTGFAEYLMKVRMEKACAFLEDIHYKSYEIAFLIGYDNPKNFSRAFKNYFNMSPLEYRNKKIKEN